MDNETAIISVAEEAIIECGTFKAVISQVGTGLVTLDGKPLDACCGFNIRVRVGEEPRIIVQLVPGGQ